MSVITIDLGHEAGHRNVRGPNGADNLEQLVDCMLWLLDGKIENLSREQLPDVLERGRIGFNREVGFVYEGPSVVLVGDVEHFILFAAMQAYHDGQASIEELEVICGKRN